MIHGIDIGGTKIEIAVFDRDLVAVDRWRVATPQRDYDAFVDTLADLIAQADGRHGPADAIGLGVPGLVNGRGETLSANVPGANGRQVTADVAARIGRPVVAENDCRSFALSEAIGGAGDGHGIVFGAILGTGAAGGLVIDGTLVRGRQGIAGEYGHIPLPAALIAEHGLDRLDCGCGLLACYETYIAGPGLMRLAAARGVAAGSVPELVARWQAGDAAAIAVRDCFFDLVGSVFATVAMMVDPDVIVLGGGLSLIDDLIAALPGAIKRHLFAGFTAPAIARARFGDSSGARGAAILAQRVIA